MNQLRLSYERPDPPLVIAYGMGVDSTAMMIGLKNRGERPDLILFADTGDEKDETYEYENVIQDWLKSAGFPPVITVRYQPQNYKNWPPYYTLGQNCLTNGTLPSLAFGFKSCSLKWKVAPQNKYTDTWAPALECWGSGGKVRKMIGYDASPKDRKRFAIAVGVEDPQYHYEYPLIDWGWDRDRCKAEIREEGLPVPPKSACKFCPATKPDELREFKAEYLRYIVIMEARAWPRLEGRMTQKQLDARYEGKRFDWLNRVAKAEAAGRKPPREPKPMTEGKGCQGLWRKATKARPGSMTEFIREEGLLPEEEIDKLIESAPEEIVRRNEQHAVGLPIPEWHDFLEWFTPEDGEEECGGCSGCSMELVSLPT